MSAIVVIPARYDSTRFPGKPVVPLRGKPLIQHVYENATGSVLAGDVLVATDSETIYETVFAFGGRAVMTSRDHASGTDRVAEVARSLDCDIIVNVQGDEPLIQPRMIDDVIALLSGGTVDIGTLAKRITDPAEVIDPNVVKVAFGEEGRALYFSRAPIPYDRDAWKDLQQSGLRGSLSMVFKHVGIYGYRRDVLLRLTGMKPTKLEQTEKLEQLRALEYGFTIKVRETSFETFGVDTPQDMERVGKWLSLSS